MRARAFVEITIDGYTDWHRAMLVENLRSWNARVPLFWDGALAVSANVIMVVPEGEQPNDRAAEGDHPAFTVEHV